MAKQIPNPQPLVTKIFEVADPTEHDFTKRKDLERQGVEKVKF